MFPFEICAQRRYIMSYFKNTDNVIEKKLINYKHFITLDFYTRIFRSNLLYIKIGDLKISKR